MTTHESWLDADSGEESPAETVARGGALSEAGRQAAIASTLPVLGLYFASGQQPLETRRAIAPAVDPAPDPTSALLAGIRLRVALAAAERLLTILKRIMDRPTFRYQLRSIDSTGIVTGQIDVTRYLTQIGTVSEVRTYPVWEARRVEGTPENVLAVYAGRWLLGELRDAASASAMNSDGPEWSAHKNRSRALIAALNLPGLATCAPMAMEINRRRSERALLAQVQRRLRRREVANPSPYTELLAWVDRCLRREPAAEPGSIDWSFYGDRFDTKLFELWCLHAVAQSVSAQLVTDLPPLEPRWRAGTAAYTWDRPAGVLRLYFQKSIGTISGAHTARWRRTDTSGSTLGGVPDFVVQATLRHGQKDRFAVVDAKLRQRGGPPAEELYKILGYLDNFAVADDPNGAILYHTTETGRLTRYEYRREAGPGTLLAVALNPADLEASKDALAPVTRMLLGLLGIPPLASDRNAVAQSEEDDHEMLAERQVAARVRELHALAQMLPTTTLDASRRRVRAMLGDQRWNLLPVPVQTMLATSEHVGFSLESTADFSGPVIGVCASVEVIVHDRLIEPAVGQDRRIVARCRTLGQAIHATRSALRRGSDPLHLLLRQQIDRLSVDKSSLADLLDLLDGMNRRFRIPAAHRDLIVDSTWHAAWTSIVGQDRMLGRTLDVLSSP